MSTLEVKELSHPSGEVIKIASGKTLDLNSQGTLVLPTVPHAKMPSGSVLQVVSAVNITDDSATSSTWVDSSKTLNITPTSTSSKILLMLNTNIYGSIGTAYWGLRWVRVVGGSSTPLGHATYGNSYARTAVAHDFFGGVGMSYVDSPSTTSEITYKIQFYSPHGSNYVGFGVNSGNATTMTIMEIQG